MVIECKGDKEYFLAHSIVHNASGTYYERPENNVYEDEASALSG